MADVLDHGIIVPSGSDYISRTGVEEVRTLGRSVATALGQIATAYDVAVVGGYQGTMEEWLDSLVGPQGEEGPYGGTAVTDPQVAALVAGGSETHGALEARYRTSTSVMEHGAVGDGVTDDTAAIQRALSSVPQGGAVNIPDGVFSVAALTIPAGVALSGTGKSTLRVRAGSVRTVLHLAGAGASLTGLRIDGNSAEQTGALQTLVRVSGEACRLEGLYVRDAVHEVFVLEPTAVHAVLDSCVLAGNGIRGNCNGFSFRSSFVTVSNCHVYDHGNGHAFRVGNTEADPPGYITFTGCIVERSEHNAWTMEIASKFVTLSNCIARDVPQAIKGDVSAHHITVSDCTFENIGLGTAVNMRMVDHCIFSGVRLRNAPNGLLLGHNATVSGCSVENIAGDDTGTVYGIYAQSGIVSDCTLTNVAGRGVSIMGGSVQGCILTGCGNSTTDFLVLLDTRWEERASSMIGNIVRNPGNGGHPTGTAFCLWGSRAVVQGNVLEGALPRGVRVVDGGNDYIVMGNVVGSATTPVMEGNGANRVVAQNI